MLPTSLGLTLELHSDAPDSAWLPADASEVVLENARGSVVLGLTSGDCDNPTLTFDGIFASGSGTWRVVDATGSFREATGSGTFALLAQLGQGTENVFDLDSTGTVSVLDPGLAVELVRARWEPGREDGAKHAQVTFLIENTGPGDAFGVSIEDASAVADGVSLADALPQALGDVPSGGSALVELRYRIEKDKPKPCKGIDHGCSFDVALSVDMPDALDAAATHAATVRVQVPTAPGKP